ncbi:MAG: glutamine--fructose-6-phosphate transaminase (isomerizing) [Bacteriovoracaceae bacterium]|jgi:glutamine---fructose-6-phosphate transaminase (isomerizing)|nr:glutamine--fructose-6-phosphate transaminase (isomerizing) [Bacteriovoracaceae bacterium]
MCGIVGHIGDGNSVEVILAGLKRLEYRGYDSAGLCIKTAEDELVLYKKAGKLENLENLVRPLNLAASIGIGHTRWATHGGVTDFNAHPHVNGNIALVCNGIIENAGSIKKELLAEGWEFKSETDTEVFLILVKKALSQGMNFRESVCDSFKKVRGNSALVVLDRFSNEIVCIRRSAPIVMGLGADHHNGFIASDPYALVGHVEKIFFPENEVLGVISEEDGEYTAKFFELDLTPSTRFSSQKQSMSIDVQDKGEHEHFMLKEIHEQPHLIRNLISYYFDGEGSTELEKASEIKGKSVHISACGTAWHAGLMIKNYIESTNRIPTHVELASEFRYRNPLLNSDEIGLFISQSGETADTLAACELCKEKDLKTLSIVNVEGSTLYRECDRNLLIQAGREIGVASTKAFTLQVLTGFLYSQSLASEKLDTINLKKSLLLLADGIDEVLAASEEIKKVAESIYNLKGFLFTGRGSYFPVALEGALKLKEIAYVHAEGYASGELKHGPLALIDEEMANIAIVAPELFEKTISNVEEIKARKGVIVIIGPDDSEIARELSDYYIPVNFSGLGELSPLLVNVVNQLLSYYMAKYKGTDIDKPRNLAKSVTVE